MTPTPYGRGGVEPDASARAGSEHARASIATAAGEWHLGWDPRLATFWGRYRRRGTDGGLVAQGHDLGAEVASCPSVGALEEALGFALPADARAALSSERERRPPLAYPRSALVVGDPARPRDVDTYPTWDSPVAVLPDGRPCRYGLRMEQERPVGIAELGEGTVLELLGGVKDPATAGQRVEYRLTHQGRVVLAGDDIHAPADADLAAGESVKALLSLVLDPDAPHRSRPMSPAQAAFAATHGDRLRAAAEPRDHPYSPGTRVAPSVSGVSVVGTVTYVATDRAGNALAYAWRPDTADLAGHPWRDHPEHNLVSPPGNLSATLAPPLAARPSQGEPLSFGAVVALAHPDTGERIEAVVQRAYRDGSSDFAYQVQPTEAGAGTDMVVAEQDCALVRGTWWTSKQALVAARKQAGIEVTPGEVLGGVGGALLSLVADGPVEPSPLTAAQAKATLNVDVAELPPSMLKVSMHGKQMRVGDPQHGWVVADADRWLAAMVRPKAELEGIVNDKAPGTLHGNEPAPVLAALAAHHAPEAIGPVPPGLAERVAPSAASASGATL